MAPRTKKPAAHKQPFDIHIVLHRITGAVAEHADAAMFELAERGFRSVFQQLIEIARRTVDDFGGELPCDFEILTSFRGVGPKCANLTKPAGPPASCRLSQSKRRLEGGKPAGWKPALRACSAGRASFRDQPRITSNR